MSTVHVDCSSFPGLALLDDELIRLNLVPLERGGGTHMLWFSHAIKAQPGGYKNRPSRMKMKLRNEKAAVVLA